MGFFKKFFSGLLKIMLILLIIILVIAIGLFIFYFVTQQEAISYLPDDFFVYVKIQSLRDIYDNVIDLKAADLIFSSSSDLKSIQKAILEFKSNDISKNYFFKKLLEVKADIVIAPDYSPIIVLNPGILSLVTRFFPQINSVLKIEGITTTQTGKTTLHRFETGDKDENGENDQGIYFSVINNLVLLSTKPEHIKNLYAARTSNKNLKGNKEIMDLREKIKSGGFTDIYINSQSIISSIAEGNKELAGILSEITFNNYSALSFKISNRDLFLSAYTTISVPNEALHQFLDYNPSSLQVIKYLPAVTTIYSTLNCKSFKNLVELLFYFREGPESKTMKTINDSANLLIGATADELLFDWMGSEAGVFTMETTPDPVIFVKINDQSKIDSALEKISKALFFEDDASLVLDNVRVNKIKFPPFVKGIIDLFVKGIDAPYYIKIGDYIFLSMNAENLSGLSNYYRSNESLVREDNYKAVTREIPKNANIFLYYNLGSALPAFLARNTLINKLFKLYETGVFSIHYNEKEVRIEFSANGVAGDKSIPFPGFPVHASSGITSHVYCDSAAGSAPENLIYIDNDNNLIIRDIIEEKESKVPVERNSEIYIPRGFNKNIFVFSKAGTLYLFDKNANPIDPFPLITSCKGSFFPVEYDNKLVFYSETDKSLYFISRDGNEEKFNFDFPSPLLAPPAFLDNIIAFYPKSFSGTVYLTDARGTIREGWPKQGGGISFCSPVLYKNKKKDIVVIFLTQSGVLSVWDVDGNPVPGFPLYLEGVFYNNPRLISTAISPLYGDKNEKGILVLNAEGEFTLISMTGSILKQKKVPDISDKNTVLTLFDFDEDGIDEIFAYGTKNYITGLGRNFEPLPGFPVKGSKKPAFTDLNFDKTYEMIAGSYDGNIYGYTLIK
ncbi:MAG: PQQ-like beta-propeller repeat protein [Spirochaetales bacterium]|nr:PQQ-like beta-propeller repeat protein [Spirochaetales bacterium]